MGELCLDINVEGIWLVNKLTFYRLVCVGAVRVGVRTHTQTRTHTHTHTIFFMLTRKSFTHPLHKVTATVVVKIAAVLFLNTVQNNVIPNLKTCLCAIVV